MPFHSNVKCTVGGLIYTEVGQTTPFSPLRKRPLFGPNIWPGMYKIAGGLRSLSSVGDGLMPLPVTQIV